MRILIKGGVWKNSEDEVLKAAVMKYGLNNWSRVASLLARKSPKQCKSRWYEWLDPSVKKTEWTREEEEKLLHLAKLFPTQWRTIAPIVGRTAYQCLEHYEKLLDQAQGRDEMDENDPRRLKPGEIDPHPETKPARADPMDMDEDEKEMLSEARARLANTRGKKAKRKAREKQLEEARRLAALQKRRELKAAGISTSKKYKSRKFIDYGEEVPFEAAPPVGFHEVGPEETPQVSMGLANVTLQAIEDKSRADEEKRRRKDDERKLKRLKEDNLPEAIEMINKLNDPAQLRRRTALNLPAPQLNDEELETIVKMGADAAALQAQSADSATAGLVQSYGETPGSTPLRTPKQQNTILMEAQDAIARTAMQTPLYGEANPEMNETNFSTVLPTPKDMSITPNLYAERARSGMTPGATPGATPGSTPLRGGVQGRGGMTPGPSSTPGAASAAAPSLRDGLALNQGDGDFDQMPEKLRKANQRMQMQAALGSLPAPVNEVEISMPDLMEEEDTTEQPLEEDAADADKRREREEQDRLEIEHQKRSAPVKLDLPRPVAPHLMVFESMASQAAGAALDGPQKLLQQAEAMLHEEMSTMITRDAVLFPQKGAKPPKKAPPAPEVDLSLQELSAADELLEEELKIYIDASGSETNAMQAVQAAFEDGLSEQFVFLPSAKRCLDSRLMGKKERVEAAKHRYSVAEGQSQRDTKRVKKMEDKMDRVLGGYMLKARQALQSIRKLSEERETLGIETEVFRTLSAREEKAIQSRVEELQEEVEREKQRNLKLQNRYKALKLLQKQIDSRLQ
eukprot:TRINITY_DN57066_c0_g1_i1.p1 TRINITY_DN57066_c0_g1~~TRINITY_DN57066_c0_g1_i1.p1  ORF type:complete len:798 (-),score=229.25 TRINITY_DN57066_c0_g1_i1:64-2457(-)